VIAHAAQDEQPSRRTVRHGTLPGACALENGAGWRRQPFALFIEAIGEIEHSILSPTMQRLYIRIIDLSKEIGDNTNDPFFMRVRIRHYSHGRARWLVRALGLPFRLCPKAFVGWADDTITKMGVHATTHVDAPWHYGPTDEAGRKLPTIDDAVISFGPGVDRHAPQAGRII
jgi:hypothetical protein